MTALAVPVQTKIYGDSLMKGVVTDPLTFRYRATMQRHIQRFEELFSLSVGNASRFGQTAEKGQALVEKDIADGACCAYALLEFGGNDCDFDWQAVSDNPTHPHKPFTEFPRFVEIMQSMVNALRAVGTTPVLMTLPPIDAERYFAFISRKKDPARILQFLGDVQMIYRHHELYSNAVEKIAREMETPLIDVRSRFLNRCQFQTLIGPDGIHLNEAGYEVLCGEINGFITSRREG